jgi:adenylyl-sulfate kinase
MTGSRARTSDGFVVWFTGLSGAGKSTLAALLGEALERRGLSVEILDGDAFRRGATPELGYSRRDRERNVERLALRASELLQSRRAVIVAAISPFESARRKARDLIEEHGRFAEVHVDAPLTVCIERDPKGLYRRALAGELRQFTGISDPYELPAAPEVRVDTSRLDSARSAAYVLSCLATLGLLAM